MKELDVDERIILKLMLVKEFGRLLLAQHKVEWSRVVWRSNELLGTIKA